MISSAVVVPEQPVPSKSPSPTLKRRQSSVSSDANKRPRLDTQASNGARSPPTDAMSPPRRKTSAVAGTGAEEKKRGQRLFGALLGTLSQTSKPTHRKRDEVEQRTREKLRKDQEDRKEEVRKRREGVDHARRAEQKRWDDAGVNIVHGNKRAMAGFLRTNTKPELYYRPWELKPGEEQRIREQKASVEEEITRVLAERTAGVMERKGMHQEVRGPASERVEEEVAEVKNSDVEMETEATSNESKQEKGKADVSPDETQTKHEDGIAGQTSPAAEERHKEDDHGGEELVEGQEDDVIY